MCFWSDPTRSIGFANFQARQKNVVWCEMESRVSGQFRERLPLHLTAVADWKRADSRQNDFCATNLEARLFFLEGIARFFLSPSLFLSSFISYQVFFPWTSLGPKKVKKNLLFVSPPVDFCSFFVLFGFLEEFELKLVPFIMRDGAVEQK